MSTLRGYEALIIVKAHGTEQEIARTASHLEEPIKKLGGTVESAQSLGRRRLAFRIDRQTEGHYYFIRFQAPTDQMVELERLFRLNESVVRFMILTADEAGTPASTLFRHGPVPAGAGPRGGAPAARS